MFLQINWNIETVAPDNGSWWNGELQYYTDKHDNIKVEDGILKITAKNMKLSRQRIIHLQE